MLEYTAWKPYPSQRHIPIWPIYGSTRPPPREQSQRALQLIFLFFHFSSSLFLGTVNRLSLEMSACYTRQFLARMAVSLPEAKLNSYLWRNLCNLGISRAIPTSRGCRTGRRKQQTVNLVDVSESLSPTKRICSSFSVPSAFFEKLNTINLYHSSLKCIWHEIFFSCFL